MPEDASSPPAPESAEALLALLRRLDGEGRIELRIEPRRLAHIDSPVASEADGNLWVYGFLALAVGLWLWRGILPGLAALALGVALYLTLGRAWVNRRIERRVREHGLASLDTWRRLWRFPGLTLSAGDRAGVADCASPDGNWMAFVRSLS